jgi:hypothetical protein
MLNLLMLMIQNRAERTMTLHYKITVKEYLEESRSDWFDNLAITHAEDGTTTLAGSVRDQTALYGLIAKIRDLGLTLVDVSPYTPATPPEVST